ncbi:ubiquitin-conjugating enzyme E2 I [Nematocida homosporus]|uniref:ubiquitin-conjugating enzyme E2 I n=1 Tax=Nematocida homosporus TaxID=1912981 RepID=UPI00221FAEB3|nr:ubiquitin-conjugating enzyme E2 I [Nematocida homosporus]KAI5186624.1 ubiquitin-conjugating enzyme E2 I [Nematocida homosporus]
MDAEKRILQERENWRKDRPFGFVAKPRKKPDGCLDLFNWDCSFPGPESTPFEGHTLSLQVEFFKDYPLSPPTFRFVSNVFHPNVYPDGVVCLDILSTTNWKPSINIKSALLAIHYLITHPNINSPANQVASNLYEKSFHEYSQKAKKKINIG